MSDDDEKIGFGLGGAFKGLGDMLERLAKLSEQADSTHGGEFGGRDKGFKGVWGVRVRHMGSADRSGGDSWKVEPFGDVRPRDESDIDVAPVREPMVDIFDEGECVRIVAEMPGISREHVQCDLDGDVLRLAAENNQKRYFKECLLPQSFERASFELRANNGVIEIICRADNR
jgi:HSP20 family protein